MGLPRAPWRFHLLLAILAWPGGLAGSEGVGGHRGGIMTDSMLVLPGGAKLNYAERPGTDDTLLPLVLVHGYLDSWNSWSRVVAQLARTGRRVVSLTLRGWGDSDKTGNYTIDAYAEDVVSALDALDISEVVLGGHSMGTLISTAVAARHPERVDRLILCGAAATMDATNSVFVEIGDIVAGWSHSSKVDRKFLEEFQLNDLKPYIADGRLPAEFAKEVMNWTLQSDVRANRDAWKNMMEEDHTSELGGIHVDTLIVWGTADAVFAKEDQYKLVAALGGGVYFSEVDDAPHAAIWTHPSFIAKLIDAFLGWSQETSLGEPVIEGDLKSADAKLANKLVCSSDTHWPKAESTFICYWGEADVDGNYSFKMNGFDGPKQLMALRWCRHAPRDFERRGLFGRWFWSSCRPLFTVTDPKEKCTANCLRADCIHCHDSQSVYQVYAVRLCLAARKCYGTAVKLNLPKSINEVYCAVSILNDLGRDARHGQPCLPWVDECTGDWLDCINNAVPKAHTKSTLVI